MSAFGRRTSAPTSADLVGVLASLGSTPNEVATSLQAFGVRGLPADIHQCAIALYLNAVVTGDRHVRAVAVWNDRIRISFGRFFGRPTEVPLSGCLREFIDRFDAMSYPDLVRTDAEASTPSEQHG